MTETKMKLSRFDQERKELSNSSTDEAVLSMTGHSKAFFMDQLLNHQEGDGCIVDKYGFHTLPSLGRT